MKRNVCFRSALREPVRSLFLLLLVGSISFLAISRAAEYAVVQKETDRLESNYRAIGTLTGLKPDADFAGGMKLVSASPYLAYGDPYRRCVADLQGLYNVDLDGYSSEASDKRILGKAANSATNPFADFSMSDVLFRGRLIFKNHSPATKDSKENYQFRFTVDGLEAGYPDYAKKGSDLMLEYTPRKAGDLNAVYDSLRQEGCYLVRACYASGDNAPGAWSKGEGAWFELEPLNNEGLWFLPAKPGTAADLSNPALAELAEELPLQEENRHGMCVYTSKDMSALPVTQEASREYYLTQGRWFDREDNRKASRVCVVPENFARIRRLSPGDSVTLKFRNVKTSLSLTAYLLPLPDWNAWKNCKTWTGSFQIVGVYGALQNDLDTMTNTKMYVPDSCVPPSFGAAAESFTRGRGVSTGSGSKITGESVSYLNHYSFVLRSPADVDAFQSATRGALEKLGLQTTFVQTDWANFHASAEPVRRSSAVNAGVFGAVLLLAAALAAFLYLRRRRRDFAVLRALGVHRGRAVRQMLRPFFLLGAVGVCAGGALSWRYALGEASKTLAVFQTGGVAQSTASLPPLWLAAFCAAAFAPLLLFALAGALRGVARRPVLELLQGNAAHAAGRKAVKRQAGETAAARPAACGAVAPLSGSRIVSPEKSAVRGRNPGFAVGARHVMLHIGRSPLKSVLSVAVALCFALALGWMDRTARDGAVEVDRLYRTTTVEAEVVNNSGAFLMNSGGGVIPQDVVDGVMRSGIIKSSYLEAAEESPGVVPESSNGKPDSSRAVKNAAIYAFGQPQKFFSGTGKKLTVQYAPGWDAGLFSASWNKNQTVPTVVPAGLASLPGMKPGDRISVTGRDKHTALECVVAGTYAGQIDGEEGLPLLLPASGLKTLENGSLSYAVAKFSIDPAKNRMLPKFREDMDALIAAEGPETVKLGFVIWDGELKNTIAPMEKNLSLLQVMYPVTAAVSVIIAAGLALLFLLQEAKDAAVLRVLGTAKRRARAMLCSEQVLLCVFGLLPGLLLLAAMGGGPADFAGRPLLCAGLYLAGCFAGALIGAASITNRMPLDLLQARE